mgnify:CR=1 FL=1
MSNDGSKSVRETFPHHRTTPASASCNRAQSWRSWWVQRRARPRSLQRLGRHKVPRPRHPQGRGCGGGCPTKGAEQPVEGTQRVIDFGAADFTLGQLPAGRVERRARGRVPQQHDRDGGRGAVDRRGGEPRRVLLRLHAGPDRPDRPGRLRRPGRRARSARIGGDRPSVHSFPSAEADQQPSRTGARRHGDYVAYGAFIVGGILQIVPEELHEAAELLGASPPRSDSTARLAVGSAGASHDRDLFVHVGLERSVVLAAVHPLTEEPHGAAGVAEFQGVFLTREPAVARGL